MWRTLTKLAMHANDEFALCRLVFGSLFAFWSTSFHPFDYAELALV